MARIDKNDVLNAVTVYITNENRPCPAHYLIEKFGEDVSETILQMKKDGMILGRRGRNGGIVLPDTVLEKKQKNPIEAKPIEVEQEIVADISINSDIELEEAPF